MGDSLVPAINININQYQKFKVMKKIFLLTAAPFVFLFALSAQITQEEADAIVSERLNQETLPYIVSAKENMQTDMTITTGNGETLELDYKCWVYYVSYPTANCCLGRYLIVNESNGNLLEVNAKGDAEPDDLTEWRIVEAIENPLVNTNWKLIGIVDAQTSEIKELEPKEGDEFYWDTYYTISFITNRDNCFSGQTPGNLIVCYYEIDYKTGTFQIIGGIGGTDAGEWGDGWLYRRILHEIQSFKIENASPRTLHFYYNDSKNYLKYKEIGG